MWAVSESGNDEGESDKYLKNINFQADSSAIHIKTLILQKKWIILKSY